ncbi:unnamed protein product [Alopecurus aequalis]
MASPPRPKKHRTPPPAAESDDILRKIFLLLDSPADLARACAASPAFRRVITDPRFLLRFTHRPLLGYSTGSLMHSFPPSRHIPPHPQPVGSYQIFPPYFSKPRHEEGCCYNHRSLGRPIVVCDPLHRRYTVLPAIPDDLATLVEHGDHFTAFLASPVEDELQDESLLAAHPALKEKGSTSLSFRVMCTAQSASKLVLFFFSSSSGVGVQQWRAVNFDDWRSMSAPSDDTENYHPIPTLLV